MIHFDLNVNKCTLPKIIFLTMFFAEKKASIVVNNYKIALTNSSFCGKL